MKIMILVESYPPIINSAASLYSELAESLTEAGHHVTVVSVRPKKEDVVDEGHEYFLNKFSRKYFKGVNVLRISPLSSLAKIPGGKPVRFLLSCLLFTCQGLWVKRPDVILIYSPPLYMGVSGYIISKVKQTRFVFNLQDIHPKVLFDSGIIKNQLVKRLLSKMEEVCYKKAHSFIVYSFGNKDYLLQKGVNKAVFVIPNWVDTTTAVLTDRMKSFRSEMIISDKFVVSYAGSMQQAQGLEVVVKAAWELKEYRDIIFLLAGEGPSKSVLQMLINKRNINNVLLRPVMQRADYMKFIDASDVCLVTLSSDVPLHTVPGKLADIMGCGRPVIAVVNHLGDAASIIREAGCGFSVDPGDTEAFSQAVLRLRNDKGLRKEMGDKARLFAEQNFSRAVCTKRYEEVLCHAARGDRFQQI